MDFAAKQLEPGYEKAIAGIDLRCREGTLGFDVERDVPPDHPPSEYFDAGDYIVRRCQFESVQGRKIPALLNVGVWTQLIKDECMPEGLDIQDYVNIFDLICTTVDGSWLTKDMPMPRSDWLELARCSGSVIVAFDLPARFIEWHESSWYTRVVGNMWGRYLPHEVLSLNEGWKFLGYDIVDDSTSNNSAMYTCSMDKQDYEYVFTRQSLRLNSHGILQTESDAIAAAAAFDDIMQMPCSKFSPCGVWIYEGK